jgi:hypothetical protein
MGNKKRSVMSPLTPVICLLACLMPVHGFTLLGATSEYDKRLNMLTSILAQDEIWKFVFRQNVYVDYHDHYHRDIIEELMLDAKIDVNHDKTVSEGSTPPAETSKSEPAATPSTRIAIKPLVFFRNLFLHGERYRVGTILKLAGEIMQNAFNCLAYKHTVHLLKVIRVEISRTVIKSKGSSWSGKAIPSLAGIIMKMAELEYIDSNLLKVAKFFYLFQKKPKKINGQTSKFSYTPTLNRISSEMLEYIRNNCVKAPKTEKEIAEELNVFHTSSLYNTGQARDLKDKTFKKMFTSSTEKIKSQVGDIPYTDGMLIDMWNEFLHLLPGEEDEEFLQTIR